MVEEIKTSASAAVLQTVSARLLVKNVHAMLTILAYLPRSQKFQLQQVGRAFRDHITFKSLVSARFIGHDIVTESTLLESIVLRSRKLTKLELSEVIVDLQYVSALERAFMITARAMEQASEKEESKTM